MARDFDLLGDPIPAGRGEPGRTGHIATSENVNRVRYLVLAGWDRKDIADELGISQPTLRKHYFHHRSVRAAAERVVREVKGRALLQLDAAAAAGNAAAAKQLYKIAEDRELSLLAEDRRQAPAPRPAARSMGKKAQRLQEVGQILEGQRDDSGAWSFLPRADRGHS